MEKMILSLDQIVGAKKHPSNPRELRFNAGLAKSYGEIGFAPARDALRGDDLPVVVMDDGNAYVVRGCGRIGTLQAMLRGEHGAKAQNAALTALARTPVEVYVVSPGEADVIVYDNDVKEKWARQHMYAKFVELRNAGKSVAEASRAVGLTSRWMVGEYAYSTLPASIRAGWLDGAIPDAMVLKLGPAVNQESDALPALTKECEALIEAKKTGKPVDSEASRLKALLTETVKALKGADADTLMKVRAVLGLPVDVSPEPVEPSPEPVEPSQEPVAVEPSPEPVTKSKRKQGKRK